MTLKMPAARGWAAGQTPIAAPGLQVNAFATNLEHPRWIEVLSMATYSSPRREAQMKPSSR